MDPEDIKLFHAAVAGSLPLPPDNHVELEKPKPLPLPRKPLGSEDTTQEKKRRDETASALPNHWLTRRAHPQRELSADEKALQWAMAGVLPLPESNRAELDTRQPPPRPRQYLADEQAALHESLHGPIQLQDRLEGGDEPHYLRFGIAGHVLRDLRRGRWVIQAQIDLHGLNRDQARQTLGHFLAECQQAGWRCVRVIHGKGLGSPQKLSILKQLVRGWLSQRDEVLAFCQSRPQDGGEGAITLLLRTPKKNRTT